MEFKNYRELIYMNRYFLFFLIILAFSTCFTNISTKAEPSLATITCKDYLDKFQSFKNDDKGRENFSKDLSELWSFEVQEVKKQYPDLADHLTNEIEENPVFFILKTYHDCEVQPENINKRIAKHLKELIYDASTRIKQTQIAENNGCKTMDKREMSYFVATNNVMRLLDAQTEGMLVACTEKYSNEHIWIGEDKEKPKSFKICMEQPGKKEPPSCQTILPSKEMVCLSEFGICGKNSDDKCAWMHTEKSQKCAEGGL